MKLFFESVMVTLLSVCQASYALTPSETKDVLKAHGSFGSRGEFFSSCGDMRFVTKENASRFSFSDFKGAICFTAFARELFRIVPGHTDGRSCKFEEVSNIPTSGVTRGEWALLVIADFVREFEKQKPVYDFLWSAAEAERAFYYYVILRFKCPVM